MSADSLKETFFAECEDLLEALSEGLVAIEEGNSDDETVNAIFRAVHSIKGAAGAFSMTDLVGFAHKFETVLDRIRSNVMEIDANVMRVITRSGDCLADLVEAAQADSGATPDAMESLEASLSDLSDASSEAAPAEVEPDFSFEAVAFAPIELTPDLPPATNRFQITFDPFQSLFDNGHDPALLLAQLARLGDLETRCDTARVPELDAFDPEDSYLSWKLTLSGDIAEGQIRKAFSFVEGLCDLAISREDEVPAATPPLIDLVDPDATEVSSVDRVETDKTAAGGAARDPKPDEEVKPKSKPSSSYAPRPTLRVDPERVDRLINTVGELIINQAVITQKVTASGIEPNTEIMADLDDYRYLAREIQEGVMAIRAQPVKPLFQRMARIVREAADATLKDVQLVTEGDNTEVDKTLVERLADPLTHMIRNAVDHGIEAPQQRLSAGKSKHGTVRLSAAHRSGHVMIEISDDGAGLDRVRIFQNAVDKGLVEPEASLNDAEIDNLLFMPGFSTAEAVTNLSGRGVGMDVVKTAITSLGGRVSISSTPGSGSTFSISLPLTLAVLDGMVVTLAGETMILPLSEIIETIKPEPDELKPIGTDSFLLSIRGSYVPVISLAQVLELKHGQIDTAHSVFVLVKTDGDTPVAMAVDAILDQRQVVIKSLEGNYGAVPGISAATILGDGKIALIVDLDTIVTLASHAKDPKSHSEMELGHEKSRAMG